MTGRPTNLKPAAYDLYKAVKSLLRSYESPYWRYAVEEAERALSKAEGRRSWYDWERDRNA